MKPTNPIAVRKADVGPLLLLVICIGVTIIAVSRFGMINPSSDFTVSEASVGDYGRFPIASAMPVAETNDSVPVVASVPDPVSVPVSPSIPAPASISAPVAIQAVTEARLSIPSIGVDATIEEMGTTAEGAMAVPDNRFDVGWFSPGTRPGNVGSAVVGGHNEWDGGTGVFARLNELAVGDSVSVVDRDGALTSFVVREMRTYDPTDYGGEIFNSDSGSHLNLITCSGVFDPSTGTYTKRLVVFTDKV